MIRTMSIAVIKNMLTNDERHYKLVQTDHCYIIFEDLHDVVETFSKRSSWRKEWAKFVGDVAHDINVGETPINDES